MNLKYKYGRCDWCGKLVRLNSVECNTTSDIFVYFCPICHRTIEVINPNIADTQEILSKFPDEKEENIKSEKDLDINISELMDKMIEIKTKYYETVSQVELLTIGMNNLKTIIKKFIWGEDFTTEEKDIMVNILKENGEEENE